MAASLVLLLRLAGSVGRISPWVWRELDRVVKAQQEDRITSGYVILGNEANSFIAAEEAQTVYSRLREYAPIDGRFGPTGGLPSSSNPPRVCDNKLGVSIQTPRFEFRLQGLG